MSGATDVAGRIVRVLPDVPAVNRAFDYLLPDSLQGAVAVGSMVRIPFSNRPVGGWIVELDVDPPTGVKLLAVRKIHGVGPDEAVIALARWASWRWAGRMATFLRLASPEKAVARTSAPSARPTTSPHADVVATELLSQGAACHVLQVSPTADYLPIALAAAATGQAIVVMPGVVEAGVLARRLRRAGASVAHWPQGWASAAGGSTVVGGRGAVLAPAPCLSAVVVFDEHDPTLESENSPTWHARELAIERARRANVPCLLVSPCPTIDALVAAGSGEGPSAPVRVARAIERAGWAPLQVVDRRGEDVGRSGLFSSAFVQAARHALDESERVVVLLNRTGRAKLLACRSCGSLATCDECDSVVRSEVLGTLECGRCGTVRPAVCADCGSTALSLLRLGVDRAAEELEALLRTPVTTVTGQAPRHGEADQEIGPVVIGTTAVMHRVPDAGLVAIVDLDGELFAPAYRAAESALALMVRASRLVGGRSRGGAVLVQTRHPDHEVVTAAVTAQPSLVAEAEWARRSLLGFPPAETMVVVGRAAATTFVERFGQPEGVEVLGPNDGEWMLRSTNQKLLLDAVSEVERPSGGLRLWVDPSRVR